MKQPDERATFRIKSTQVRTLVRIAALTREDINTCFAFAADRERKLFVAPA